MSTKRNAFEIGDLIGNESYTLKVLFKDYSTYGLEIIERKRSKRHKYKVGEKLTWSRAFTEFNFQSYKDIIKERVRIQLEELYYDS